jgi:sucrose-6-phosphate hydrolase SacC (GH32 family)
MARFRSAALFPLCTIACAASAVAVLASCSGGGSTSDTAPGPTLDASKIAAACFQGGITPELKLGDGFTGADWNDPHVLKVGGEYWMYASSNLGFAPTPPSPVQIYRFTSTDAVNWTLNPLTPVLKVAAAQWDQGGNETPAVVFFGGKYHMFWTGYPDAWPNLNAFNFRIGHATSTDGIAWTKDTAPLLSPSGAADFRQYIVGEPGPVVFNNTLYLYFTVVGVDAGLAAGLQTVGVMTSADGIAWSAPAQAFKPDQSVYPRASNWVGYSTPNAVVIDGEVHVFVDVANDHGNNTWTQEALHHAYSSDGLTGWTQDPPSIRRLTDFAWTAREIRSPSAFLDGTTLRLYFAGDDIGNTNAWGIGQMTCSLAP